MKGKIHPALPFLLLGKFQWKKSILRVNLCQVAAIWVCRNATKASINSRISLLPRQTGTG